MPVENKTDMLRFYTNAEKLYSDLKRVCITEG